MQGVYYISNEKGHEAKLGLETSSIKKLSVPPGGKIKGRRTCHQNLGAR